MQRMALANGSALRRLVRRLGVRLGDEDDVTQRVLLTAWRKLQEREVHCERSFLRGIAVREASHQRRTYRRRREVSADAGIAESGMLTRGEAPAAEPDELLHLKQVLTVVERIVAQLTPELHRVFVLFAMHGRTAREIARSLELPLGTVKSRLRRARELVDAAVVAARLAS